jgi:hypothetical protein
MKRNTSHLMIQMSGELRDLDLYAILYYIPILLMNMIMVVNDCDTISNSE